MMMERGGVTLLLLLIVVLIIKNVVDDNYLLLYKIIKIIKFSPSTSSSRGFSGHTCALRERKEKRVVGSAHTQTRPLQRHVGRRKAKRNKVKLCETY